VYRPEYGYTFLVRTKRPVDQGVRTSEQVFRSMDPTVPVFNAMPLADYIAGPLQGQETAARLLALLAVVASALAAIGLYGVISYAMAQRTKEIGVRIALGAQSRDVLRMVVTQAGTLLLVGLIVGLGGAVAAARVLASMLYSVGAPTRSYWRPPPMSPSHSLQRWCPRGGRSKVDPLVACGRIESHHLKSDCGLSAEPRLLDGAPLKLVVQSVRTVV
jgi:ABC-type antimicrobial peptide transport system permease subunit